jgi:murein DD-endopeptidase MepM/ murein hydrolase activator NlpD
MKFWVGCLSIALLASSCATRPLHSKRKGLLDLESGNTERRGIVFRGSGTEADADELYAPKEGVPVELYGEWQWPLKKVEVSSHYGDRGSKFHQGVDLRARIGTPVLAASDGEVVYVGSKIRGYGRMVVIKHAGNFYSVYAHHSRNATKVGRRVKRGQVIAYSGKSGRSSGPHLHFEIRKGTQSFDPQYALQNNIRAYAANRKVASDASSSKEN